MVNFDIVADFQALRITTVEKHLVKKLRVRVWSQLPSSETSKSEEDQDMFLVRWLRAREHNVDNAEAMLLKALKWRKENGLHSIFEHDMDPFFKEAYPWYTSGTDKFGQPIYLASGKEWDFRKIAENKKENGFELFLNIFMESIQQSIWMENTKRSRDQPPVTQFVGIVDLKGYPYGQMLNWTAMKKCYAFAGQYEAYYPELLFQLICFNTPWFFPAFVRLFKGIFAPKTLGKFRLYTSLEEWQKDVEHFVDPSTLPKEYGGTKTS